MKKRNIVLASAVTALLSACSGESSFEEIKNNIQNNIEAEIQEEVKNQYLSTFSGRVADGYLVGARVCLDVNLNKACDDNEPGATTEKGGAYNLEIPREILDTYSVIAEIIEGVTIDEDDGVPVKRKYTLTSPVGESFVSPMSTLVQNEIERSPELTSAQAKQVVVKKLDLGEDVDLLADYVSNQDKEVHELARKIAHILADALNDVSAEFADDGGIPEGDLGIILSVVLDEVLSRAKEINASKLEELKDGSAKPVDFKDKDQIASRVEKKKIDRKQVHANFEKISREGFYQLGIEQHCEPKEDGSGDKLQDAESGDGLSDSKAIDGKPHCIPELSRGFLRVDDAGTVIETREVYADGSWVSEASADQAGDIRLSHEGWVVESDRETVEFKDDGTAVVSSEKGIHKRWVSASMMDIGGKPVRFFLPHEAAQFAPDGTLFSEGAQSVRWSFEVLNDLYEIDFWTHCDDDAKAALQGNCNVVDGYDGHYHDSLDQGSFYFAAEVNEQSYHPQASFFVGSGLGVRLFAAEEEGGNGEARYVHFSGGDSVYPDENHQSSVVATVKWKRVQINRVDLLVIDIPRVVSPLIDDHEVSAFIVAEHNGFLRKGAFIQKGGIHQSEHPSLNKQAMDDLEALVANLNLTQ